MSKRHRAKLSLTIAVMVTALACPTVRASDTARSEPDAAATAEMVGMVEISGGTYQPLYAMDEGPRQVAPYLLDIALVTNGGFLEFVRQHPRWQRSQVKTVFANENYLKHWAGDLDLGPEAAEVAERPVNNVSWFAARAFLKSRGKRLPTSDEWEFAARADATRIDASGDPKFNAALLEWYGRPTAATLPFAREADRNFHGIRGMHGLVWEWVRDFNNAMVTGESRGDSDLEQRLYCAAGATGAVDKSDYAAFMRYAFRSSLKGNYCVANLGFRGARNLKLDETKP